MLYEDLTNKIIAAMKVHSAHGPGLLESTYHTCLLFELERDGPACSTSGLPVIYRNTTLDAGYRIDFPIENRIVVELKAVENLLPLHMAQLLTYLKPSGRPVGLLLNFNVVHFRTGITRVVNGYPLRDENELPSAPSVSSASSVVES